MKVDRWTLALAALLLLSFAGRAWYGMPDPTGRRFWDERYGLENVRSLVLEGRLQPANGYHPSLSYLPNAALLGASHALHRWTGRPAFAVFAGEGYAPTAYRLCRLLQAVLGAASIALLYLIGQRLFDRPTALAAALLLAVSPWHIRQSAIYKPDVLLVLTLELALLAALWAAARPSPRRYLWAGGAVGLALASKFNAAPIALPLALAGLRQGVEDRRRWLWLALAGLTAAAVFLLLNPFVVFEPELYLRDFSRTLRDYGRKGSAEGATRAGLLLHAAASLLGSNFHGPRVGTLALAGLAGLALAASRPGLPPRRRLDLLILLVFPFAYVGLYTAATTNPSEHNWLMLLPFSSLAAAWLVIGVGRCAASRWTSLARPPLPQLLASGAVAALLWPAWTYTYDSVVPRNERRVGAYLSASLRPLAGREVLFDRRLRRLKVRESRWERASTLPVEDLRRLGSERLELADAVVFPHELLAGAEGDFYRRLLATGERSRLFERRPFRGRGSDLVVVEKPWRPAGEQVLGLLEVTPGELIERRLELPAPWGGREGEAVSFEIWIPKLPRRASPPRLLLDGRQVKIFRQSRVLFLSERLARLDRGASPELRWRSPAGPHRKLQVRALRWLRRTPPPRVGGAGTASM